MGITITKDEYRPEWLSCVTIDWVSETDGTLSEALTAIQGTIERIVFIPATATGEQPADNYDVTLLDRDGIDVLGGKGANLSNTTLSSVLLTDTTPVLPIATNGPLTLTIANASLTPGVSGQGTIRFYLRR